MLRIEYLVLEQDDFRLCVPAAQVAEGSVVALIGPSGEGKSTLLASIAGFIDPVAGKIEWHGSDLTALGPGERPVAILFQDNNLFPHLTAEQNVGLGIRPSLKLSDRDQTRVSSALERVGLSGYGKRRPAELSGGQRSRVALARILVQDRPLWLLDEPFSALGPAMRQDMLALVRDMARDANATVLLVTHDPDDARQIAHSVMVVAGGSVAAPVSTDYAFANPSPELAAYLGRSQPFV